MVSLLDQPIYFSSVYERGKRHCGVENGCWQRLLLGVVRIVGELGCYLCNCLCILSFSGERRSARSSELVLARVQ